MFSPFYSIATTVEDNKSETSSDYEDSSPQSNRKRRKVSRKGDDSFLASLFRTPPTRSSARLRKKPATKGRNESNPIEIDDDDSDSSESKFSDADCESQEVGIVTDLSFFVSLATRTFVSLFIKSMYHMI